VTPWEVSELSSTSIKKVLTDYGLTDKEADIYIFLAKHGVIKGGEIVTRTKTHRALVYRILKSLQTKGLVETTLESPARFSAVPFETFLDLSIKAKRDEATLIEQSKKDLLVDWDKISKTGYEPTLEKFSVIEGRNKIKSKLQQLIAEAKEQLSALLTLTDLECADQFGVFEAFTKHPRQAEIPFRVITELSAQESETLKNLARTKSAYKIDLKAKDIDPAERLPPRMIIRDAAEMLLWLSHQPEANILQGDSTCLWTNCKDIVKTFASVFDELWFSATDFEQKILEIESSETAARRIQLSTINNPEMAKKAYNTALRLAKNEIMILTSAQGLASLSEDPILKKDSHETKVAVKIMAPISRENTTAAERLRAYCEVRNVAEAFPRTTIVDSSNLFQFRRVPLEQEKENPDAYLNNMFSTQDLDTIYKTKLMLEAIWKNAQSPTLDAAERGSHDTFGKLTGFIDEQEPQEKLTEQDILDKIANAKRIQLRGNPSKFITRLYGSHATGSIHPPPEFGLPDMRIAVYHCNKQSSFGAEDFMNIMLHLDTPKGKQWVPVAHVTDNPKSVPHRKIVYANTPSGKNIQVLKNDELKISLHGNTLFAGWSAPIPLLPPKYILPPACIEFEGQGKIRTGIGKTTNQSGRKQIYEYNGFEAFVTFFHPSSKYYGPGTDGVLLRDLVFTAYPPAYKTQKKSL
jgi:sugar-specific transcriptional regulator TrmB